MGRHHKHHKHHKHHHRNKVWHSISNNHTLKFLADPVKPVESVVSYGGKHLIGDVDNISSGFANNIPILVGGIVIVLYFMNK